MTLGAAPLILLYGLLGGTHAAPDAVVPSLAQAGETAKESESGHRYPVTVKSTLKADDGEKAEGAAKAEEKKPEPKTMHLLGLGIREKTVFAVNVYSYVLYVDEAWAKENLARWKGKKSKDVEKDAKIYERLLAEGGTKELRLRFCRNVDKDDVVSAFEDSIEPRMLKRREGQKGTKEEKLEDLRTFRAMFSLDKLRKNNELRFTWHPDGTLSTVINGERQEDLKSPDLCWALFDVYLGAKPISKSGKKKLVRRTPDVLAKID